MLPFPYARIVIIYNPNSTSGNAKGHAKQLKDRLIKHDIDNITLIATEYAGHAEEIAYDMTERYKTPLLVSVSGDGGYNEVINGALRAQDKHKKANPVCAILAAGNANDHRRMVRKRPLAKAILTTKPEAIDVLKIETSGAGTPLTRYAHSYIGFGFTGLVARRLNQIDNHNLIREMFLVWESFLHRFRPISTIDSEGHPKKYDNLIFTKLHRMSKVFRVGQKTDLHNGTFHLISHRHRNRMGFIGHLIGTVTVGYRDPVYAKQFAFTLTKTEWAHCDGEVFKVAGGSRVQVSCMPEKMLTLR